MDRSVRRVALVVLIAAVAVVSTGCGPGAGEGLVNAYFSIVGPIIGVGILLLIAIGGIPKP
jgi:hypothetical protein